MLELVNALCLLVAVLFVIDALRRIERPAWQGEALTIWLLFTGLALAGLRMRIALPGSLELHYLGAPFLALTLGYPRAVLSMTVAVLATALLDGQWTTFGITCLVNAALPVWLMTQLLRVSQRLLPVNLFVYLLGLGFFGLFLVMAIQNVVHTLLLWALGIAGLHAGITLGYGLLLAAGEAILEGMLLTVLVVYIPRMVATFDDAVYLQARREL